MPQWLKKILGEGESKPVRPSEVPADQRAQDLVNLGDKMFSIEDYQGAEEAYNSALTMDGHHAAAWQRRGRIFSHQGKFIEAMACHARALELDGRQSRSWLGLGEAILSFVQADLDPPFIRENRTEIIAEALDCFQRAQKFDPELAPARQGLESCRALIGTTPVKMANPRLFSFHSRGVLEKAKREVVSPFLKPGDYRRKPIPLPADD